MTYSEIQKGMDLYIPKSTLSIWCQGVTLPLWYEEKVRELNKSSLTKAQRYAWAQIKRKRELFLEAVSREAKSILKRFNQDGLKIALAMLYLGEGAKWRSHSGLVLGNSDPEVICLYISLLRECYKIETHKLKCRVSYRADQNIHELENYWSKITGITQENFYKTKPDPRTIGKRTLNPDYKGVCVIHCAGAHIQLELEMIAKLLLQEIRARSLVAKRLHGM